MSTIKGSMEESIHYKHRRNEEQEALRKALEGIKLECEMVGIAQGKMEAILLCDKVIADWEACIKWMDEQPADVLFDPMEVADRALQSVMNLAASLQWGEEEVEMQPLPQPAKIEDAGVDVLSEDETDGQGKGSTVVEPVPYAENRDEDLELHVIQVMAMAGTEKDGTVACWTVENLQYGLVKMHPRLSAWTLTALLRVLEEEHVVKEVTVPRRVGSEMGYVLADEHAGPVPRQENVDAKIHQVLESAKDENGDHVAWTRNQIWFAVKRTDASLSQRLLDETLKGMAQHGSIVVHEGTRNTYVALNQEDMDRFLELARERGVEPTPETEPDQAPLPEPTPRPAEPPSALESSDVVLEKVEAEEESPEVAPIDQMSWADVEKMMGIQGDAFASTDAALVLSEMRKQKGRLWRDYDLEGLFKGRTEPLTMTSPDGEDGALKKALGQLIGMRLVEHLPRESRPGLHEERWGLTELGRVS